MCPTTEYKQRIELKKGSRHEGKISNNKLHETPKKGGREMYSMYINIYIYRGYIWEGGEDIFISIYIHTSRVIVNMGRLPTFLGT